MAASEFQEFTVGGVIHRFDAHDARRKRWGVGMQVPEQLELGAGRTDDQDFTGILDRVSDSLVVHMILRGLARTDSAVLVVQVFVLGLRMDYACFGVVRVELDDMRFAVIDPDDTVKVAHCVVKLSESGWKPKRRLFGKAIPVTHTRLKRLREAPDVVCVLAHVTKAAFGALETSLHELYTRSVRNPRTGA